MKTFAVKTLSKILSSIGLFVLSTELFAASSVLQTIPSVSALKAVAGSSAEISVSKNSGHVNFLSTANSRPIPLRSAADASAESRAMEFIGNYGKAFGLSSPRQVRTLKISGKDETGMEHVRLQQLYNGVPVTAGEMTVHLRGNSVVSVLSKTLPTGTVDVNPQLSAADVEVIVRDMLKKRGIDNAVLSAPKLEVFNKGMLQGKQSASHLAWFIEAKKTDLREFIWVDAHRGAILLSFSQLPDARSRKVYDANSSSDLPGTLVQSEGQSSSGDPDADAAYNFSGDTYDYFKTQHGRDSFDGLGAPIISTVHYCPSFVECPYGNAFWSGEQMVYGEGFSAADDVDAHELTHAVTDYSANLYYYAQSGGLNESFSDIFGETVDLGNRAGTDTAAVKWLMGEDVPGLGAIRNMKNPGAFKDPAKVNDVNFKCDISDGDQGGVHSNSGVPNHAYQLMVDGGVYNGQTIKGIGLTKAGKIQYRALTQYLTSGSTFLDNYNSLQSSCTDLIGTAGITAANCAEVKKALLSVQMNSPVCSQSVTPTLCPVGKTAKSVFFDDFEASGRNFATDDFSIWGIVQGFSKSGALSAYGRSIAGASESFYKMTKNVKVPVRGKMQFDHAFEFEHYLFDSTRYDGGIVEYSINNGITWADAGKLIVAGQKYNGKIYTGADNPLAGKSAFTFDSFGYTATQLDLSTLAGKNIRFRFKVGSDAEVAFQGWFIDNVQIYSCQ